MWKPLIKQWVDRIAGQQPIFHQPRRNHNHDEKAEDLHFLPKPFGLKQLAAKVKDVLSNSPAPARTGTTGK